jgi:phosphoribosylanthranilate isomerase
MLYKIARLRNHFVVFYHNEYTAQLASQFRANHIPFVLVDAYVDSYGGEGKRLALEWFDGIDCSKMILAGGLDSNNIQEVKKYNFYGVDVSSGVEASKGKKDLKKLKTFIQNSKN